jgi:hypothetical protein
MATLSATVIVENSKQVVWVDARPLFAAAT